MDINSILIQLRSGNDNGYSTKAYPGRSTRYAATIKQSIALADTMGLTHNAGKLLALLDQPGKPAAYSYQSNEVTEAVAAERSVLELSVFFMTDFCL